MKVVENHSQPLSAYQYFENVRNFLVAVEELKLPAFEASDIERVNKHLYLGIRYQVNWVLILVLIYCLGYFGGWLCS